MPCISICPACKEKVAIPDGVAETAALRCPLCQAEYSLNDVAASVLEAPPVLVLAEPAETELFDSAETEAVAGQDEPDSGEPEDRLAAEVEALRSKTETFQSDADLSAQEPRALQDQADALGLEAHSLLAKVGRLAAEAREAESKAMAIVAKAEGYKKSAGQALAALAEALDIVAQAFDQKCATLMIEIDAQSSTETDEECEPPAPAAEAEKATALAVDDAKQTEAAVTAEEATAAESDAVAESEAGQEEAMAPEGDGIHLEEDELDGIHLEEDEIEEPPADAPETAAIEGEAEEGDSTDESREGEEAPAVAEAPAPVDPEVLRARLEGLMAVASALKAKAAELRTEAVALLGEPGERVEATEEAAEGAEWGGPWQPESSAPAIDVGVPSLSFGEGEGRQASGRTVRPGRKRKEKSFLSELVGIVLGGAAGLMIAYYGLNFFGGVRYDFAKIYLPGIKHTVKHRPAWWPEWARFEDTESPQDEGEAAKARRP